MYEIRNLVETAAYVDDLDRAERFYHDVLELEVIGREAGRHVFFRVGNADVLLLFNPDETGQGTAPSGRTGPGTRSLRFRHRCRGSLASGGGGYRTLESPSKRKMTWPKGGHSLYFRDPAGNSVRVNHPGIVGTAVGLVRIGQPSSNQSQQTLEDLACAC